jgi:hypothetical protein
MPLISGSVTSRSDRNRAAVYISKASNTTLQNRIVKVRLKRALQNPEDSNFTNVGRPTVMDDNIQNELYKRLLV